MTEYSEHRLYDGHILRFPVGTDPALIQETVKKETARRRNQSGAANLWEDVVDVGAKIGTQLNRGIADVVGMPRALLDIAKAVPEAVLGPTPKTGPSIFPTSEDVQAGMRAIGIPEREMENQTVAAGIRGIPGAMLGPGGVTSKLALGVAGGVGSELAGQAAEGTPFEQFARVAGALAGGLTGQKVGTGLERVGRATMGQRGPVMQPFQQLGIKPQLATQVRPESTGLKWWQNAISNMPGGFDRMQKAAQSAIDDVAGAIERRAEALGTATTKQEAGLSLQKGGADWLNKFGLQEERLWNEFFRSMPSDTPVHLARTKAALANVKQSMPDMPQTEKVLLGSKLDTLQQAVIADLAKSAQGGAVDSAGLESVKNMRSIVGNIIKEPPLMNDMTRGKWAELYAALSEDIKEAALRHGSATRRFDALDKFNKANDFTREGHQFVGNTLSRILDKSGGITPEQAAGWAMAESKKGATQIGALRAKFDPAEWEDFTSYVIRSLGKSTPGAQTAAGDAFSPSTFMKRYSELDPAARSVLFKGTSYGGLADDMAAVAKVAEGLRDTAKLANSSRTAGTSLLMEVLQGAGGAALGGYAGGVQGAVIGATATIAGPVIGARAASTLLTNKRFINWLATPASLDDLPKRLKVLAVIGQTSPETAPAIAEYLAAIHQQLQSGTPGPSIPVQSQAVPSQTPQVVPGFNFVPQ